MKIKELEVIELHGYLSKKIFLNKELNYLIGINGSGKTSILKILKSFYEKDFSYFNEIEFKNIKIKTEKEEYVFSKIVKGKSKETAKKEVYYYEKTKSKIAVEIKKNLILKNLKELEKELESYDCNKEALLNKIENHKNDLKRYEKSVIVFKADSLQKTNDDKSLALGITFEDFEKETVDVLKVNLKKEESEDIIEEFITTIFPIRKTKKILEDIGLLYLQNISLERELEFLNNDLKKILKSKRNLNDFEIEKKEEIIKNKIEELRKEFTKEIKEKNISEYLNCINSFFVDCYKKLKFDTVKAKFYIEVLNKNGEKIKEITNLSKVSSGEQQILSLFTELIFNSENVKYIIIDEPERSTHIEWQKNIILELGKILEKRSDIQVIIATHSYNLVGKNTRNGELIPIYPYSEVEGEK